MLISNGTYQKGPVVRIGPNKFSFDDPSDARIIYDLRSQFPKAEFYKAMGDPDRPSLFSTRDEVDHTARKRQISGLYSMSTLVNYEPAVDKMITTAMKKLSEFAHDGRLVSMDRFFHYFAFDLIVRITYNRDIGLLERFEDLHSIIANIEKIAVIGPILGIFPELIPWFRRFGRARGQGSPGFKMAQSNRDLIALVRQDHIKPSSNTKSEPFAYKCFALEAAEKLTPQGTLDSCGGNINAGSDTIGSTLSALTHYLYNDPSSLARLRSEIDEAAATGSISSPITFREAKDLPYLQAVIKEALRLRPAVSMMLSRVVPAGGAELAGHSFPAGAEVGINGRVMHLNARVHGPDCTIWRPERWLEMNNDHDDDKGISSNFAFGAGKRVCLGKNIAMLEMFKIVPELVRNCDLEFEKDSSGKISEPVRAKGIFMWMRYRCRVTKR